MEDAGRTEDTDKQMYKDGRRKLTNERTRTDGADKRTYKDGQKNNGSEAPREILTCFLCFLILSNSRSDPRR